MHTLGHLRSRIKARALQAGTSVRYYTIPALQSRKSDCLS